MKILYVLDVFPVAGGAETVTRTLANELVARGHEVHVVSFRERRDIEVFVDPRVREHRFPVPSPKLCRENTSFLRGLLLETETDLIVCQSLPPLDCNTLCHVARRGTGARLVQCYHGALLYRLKYKPLRPLLRHVPDWIYRPWKTWREIRLMNRAYDRSDRLVLLSESYVRQYAEICQGRDLDRLRAIPNPVPSENGSSSDKQRKLLFVGRLQEPVKRLRFVLEVWRRLSQREENRGWKLAVVGDGPDMEAAKGWVSTLERVSLEGFQDPASYYREASILLMTSAFEGLPMTLIEAQRLGCVPVVMDSFLSLRDIVDDRDNGRIVPDGDLDAFTDVVQELMREPLEVERMAARARLTSRRFDPSPVADRWEDLFAEVLGESPRSR